MNGAAPDTKSWLSGPGGLAHVSTTDFATGAAAFGIGSGSLNGLRINGLVGNASM